jgi:hypothetical protein
MKRGRFIALEVVDSKPFTDMDQVLARVAFVDHATNTVYLYAKSVEVVEGAPPLTGTMIKDW